MRRCGGAAGIGSPAIDPTPSGGDRLVDCAAERRAIPRIRIVRVTESQQMPLMRGLPSQRGRVTLGGVA